MNVKNRLPIPIGVNDSGNHKFNFAKSHRQPALTLFKNHVVANYFVKKLEEIFSKGVYKLYLSFPHTLLVDGKRHNSYISFD